MLFVVFDSFVLFIVRCVLLFDCSLCGCVVRVVLIVVCVVCCVLCDFVCVVC